jgi:hypothetical protein
MFYYACLLVDNLFIKRTVCITCRDDISSGSKTCSKCPNDKPQRLALVFDAMQELMFTRTYDRLFTIINSYREMFTQRTLDTETNDIVYNRNYKTLCDSIDYPFISIILHLDGISLSKSNKQPMWILSCSIVELPPVVRNHRQNNLILSIWIGKQQPDIELWLRQTFNQLTYLKSRGKYTF